MNLIKRVTSCALALSIALSGVYATAAEPAAGMQKSSNISSSVKNKIIGGFFGGVGVGLLASAILSVVNHCSNKLNVLIIGQNGRTREKFIDAITRNKRGLASNFKTVLESGGGYDVEMDESTALIGNWDIHECNLDDPNAARLAEKAALIIPILDSQDTVDRVNNMLEYIPSLYGKRIISVIDTKSVKCPEQLALHHAVHGNTEMTMLDCDAVFKWSPTSNEFTFAKYGRLQYETITTYYRSLKDFYKEQNSKWNSWIQNNPRKQA